MVFIYANMITMHHECNAYTSVETEDDDEDDEKAEEMDRLRAGSKHRQLDTMEAINMAVDASLEEMGGKEVKSLNQEQKKQLITFMDFVDAEPDPSIKYLREANWDIQVAMNTYLRQHPDHVCLYTLASLRILYLLGCVLCLYAAKIERGITGFI